MDKTTQKTNKQIRYLITLTTKAGETLTASPTLALLNILETIENVIYADGIAIDSFYSKDAGHLDAYTEEIGIQILGENEDCIPTALGIVELIIQIRQIYEEFIQPVTLKIEYTGPDTGTVQLS